VSDVCGSALRSVFWELHLLSHFVGMFHQVQHSELAKTSQFFSVFGGMLPEHKIPWGISENGRPTPVSILFFKMPHSVFFMISNGYPPDIHHVSQNFQKQIKSCCSCSFERAVKLVFGVWACWRAGNCGPSNGWLTSPLHSGHGRT
jgi:hypothetical protein